MHELQWGRDLSVAEGPAARCHVRHAPRASMGPRPFGRGRSTIVQNTDRRGARFNGAATFRSRKGGGGVDGIPPIDRASMGPRPFGRGRGEKGIPRRPNRQASMGPRPFGRGRHGRATRCAGCGRRFNGAATFRSRKAKTMRPIWQSRSALQWGRDLSVAEGNCKICHIGPRNRLQWGRDLSVAEGIDWPASAASNSFASMGPRPFGRGRYTAHVIAPPNAKLQWGRDLSVAEGCPVDVGGCGAA